MKMSSKFSIPSYRTCLMLMQLCIRQTLNSFINWWFAANWCLGVNVIMIRKHSKAIDAGQFIGRFISWYLILCQLSFQAELTSFACVVIETLTCENGGGRSVHTGSLYLTDHTNHHEGCSVSLSCLASQSNKKTFLHRKFHAIEKFCVIRLMSFNVMQPESFFF